MDRLPGIFNYKDEAYVIHLHRGMALDDIVSDVCKRWTLSAEKVELKCRIPEQYNSKMTMTSGEDVDRMIDMHAMLNSRIMNVEVHVSSPQDVLTIRPSSALSSGNASNVLALEVNSSQDESNRSELWYEIIHSVGQTLNSVEHVRSELTKFAIARGFDYIFVKNDLTRVTVKCKVAKCNWYFHAIRVGGGPHFQIKQLDNVHTCGGGLSTQRHPRASKKWVGSIIQGKIADSPLYRPKDIKKDIFRDYGVDVPYYQAWWGKEYAYRELLGDERCSFDSLRWYKDAIECSNPNSIVDLEAIPEIFPESYNAYCLRHLKANFSKHVAGKCHGKTTQKLLSLFDQAAYAYRAEEHEVAMRTMDFNDVQIRPPLTKSRPGRRKKNRIPSQQSLEFDKMVYTCSRCKQPGHNRKSCSNPIVE
ncbi:hypothetical protein Taro_053574, partial [Colocasia esculenta]|nr:hypothetical protein [Colocasia esculenta]